ncbi:hypothetical protein ACTL6U_05405 [Rhodovibrionaceae bacterium A322]
MHHAPLSATALALVITLTATPLRADYARAVEHLDNHRLAQAIVEFKAATAAGDLRAQVALADLALADLVPDLSQAGAIALFLDAAQRGDAVAQLNIGDYYARGAHGLPRDRVKAWVWLSRAAAQGRMWAAQQRSRIERLMTETERAEASKLLES